MKYKIGDKVRIVSERTPSMNMEGKMDKYLGSTMTISRLIRGYHYEMVEDDGRWVWNDDMIEELVNKYAVGDDEMFEDNFNLNFENHKKLCNEIHELYKLKNANYGNSFSELFEEFEMSYVVPRLVEKTNRIKTLTLNKDLDYDDESIRDSLLDLANYSIMTVMELDKDAYKNERGR